MATALCQERFCRDGRAQQCTRIHFSTTLMAEWIVLCWCLCALEFWRRVEKSALVDADGALVSAGALQSRHLAHQLALTGIVLHK